jgi:hypothetical protein
MAFIIVTRSRNQPHPTLQILRHTGLPPGQLPLNKLDNGPVGCAGNTNYSNCRAVVRNACPRKPHYTNALD